jgi:hypothetical protein
MPEDLTRLKDGGIIDEESLPENLKGDKCHNYTIVKIEKKLVNSSTTHKLGSTITLLEYKTVKFYRSFIYNFKSSSIYTLL